MQPVSGKGNGRISIHRPCCPEPWMPVFKRDAMFPMAERNIPYLAWSVRELGTAADSLAALDYAVFQHRLCSWRELRDILSENWKGHEALRQELRNRAPKWGCNDPCPRIFTGKQLQTLPLPSSTGRPMIRKVISRRDSGRLICFFPWKGFSATPDGRASGSQFQRMRGPPPEWRSARIPALLHSTAKLDASLLGDGAVVDVTLHPSTVDSENGAAVIASLIRTFFDLGGFFIHFNIFDSKTLKDAQISPEKYKDLQVRVCGWNALFSDLSKEMQDSFIRESEGLEA